MSINNNSRGLFILFLVINLFLFLTLAQSSCSTASFREQADSLFLITDDVNVYYNLKIPDDKYFLPYSLSEISGITHLNDTHLLCVEDEGGKVYEYNLLKRKITNTIAFSNPGDFEGIELVGDTIYVLESDGDIYEFTYTKHSTTRATKHENQLSRKNDTEGLGYNPYTGRLMIACKEDEDIEGTNAKGKAVYEFDLHTKRLVTPPLFEISREKMDDFFEAHRDFEYDKNRIKFEPSGIAYNPLDGHFYLLASVGKLLVVLDRNGTIKATYPIAPRVLSQPEGISFSSQGVLYISSEGEGDKGYILKFSPHKK
ncbi:conserved hypothetical protein [Marinoscillum sp. 108]|nr:conserved hypothetical protein [Marinoscillum sp. 108]